MLEAIPNKGRQVIKELQISWRNIFTAQFESVKFLIILWRA